MKTVIAIMFVLCVWRIADWCIDLWEMDQPKPEVPDCSGRGFAIIINGKWVACTSDPQTSSNMWIPEKGMPPMLRMQIPDDAFIDAPED